MREVVIAGVGIHKFGRFPDKDYRDLGREATAMALKDANVTWPQIQMSFCGNVMAEMTKGHQVLNYFGELGSPIINIENACASGGVSLWMARNAIASGQCDIALVLGVEKAPAGFIANCGYDRWQMYTGQGANPAHFAMITQDHMLKNGLTVEHIAQISVKNHRNGVLNPFAMYQKETPLEVVLNSPMVSPPLTLLMLCAPNEGAAAAVLMAKDVVKKYTSKYVTIAATAFTAKSPVDPVFPDFSMPTNTGIPFVTARAGKMAYEEAGIGPEDLDLAELQDTDVGLEIRAIDYLGLCQKGELAKAIETGEFEPTGRIPVNVSGGLLSKGEPLGASSMGQIVECTWQLRGDAGSRQIKDAKVALCHTEGAAGNCSITILKK